jgi:hypothetical protein
VASSTACMLYMHSLKDAAAATCPPCWSDAPNRHQVGLRTHIGSIPNGSSIWTPISSMPSSKNEMIPASHRSAHMTCFLLTCLIVSCITGSLHARMC